MYSMYIYSLCVGVCSVAGQMQGLVDICRAQYSIRDEDTADYGIGWTDLPEPIDNSTPVCHHHYYFHRTLCLKKLPSLNSL